VKRAALALALAVAGCPSHPPAGTPDAASDDAGAPSWQVILQHLDGTLLAVWGTSTKDVYAVGGPRGNTPFRALVMHYDGTAWKRLDANNADTYWWVHGSSATDVWMAGENGRISHWDGATFVDHSISTKATIFGVWAASPSDAWAVGGTPDRGTSADNDIVLHWDGTSWTPSPLPQTFGRTFFKVWGSGPDDVYVVGEAGTIWHRAGGAWTLESNPPVAHGTLLTVNGCGANDVYAVGSRDVLHLDGAKWTPDSVTLENDVNGVACGPGGVLIVGFGGSKQRKVAGVWNDDFGTKPYADLHGAWVDPAGGMWAAGGSFIADPQPGVTRDGVLAYYGPPGVATTILP
jgi:hypothetical protein